jgi:hypothetical protein
MISACLSPSTSLFNLVSCFTRFSLPACLRNDPKPMSKCTSWSHSLSTILCISHPIHLPSYTSPILYISHPIHLPSYTSPIPYSSISNSNYPQHFCTAEYPRLNPITKKHFKFPPREQPHLSSAAESSPTESYTYIPPRSHSGSSRSQAVRSLLLEKRLRG